MQEELDILRGHWRCAERTKHTTFDVDLEGGSAMSYDQVLVERIRRVFTEIAPVEERRMFGGIAFLVAGKMVVAASHQGDLMIRVAPEGELDLARETGVELRPMEMRGRIMSGWCRISAEDLADDEVLVRWIDRAVDSLGMPPGALGT